MQRRWTGRPRPGIPPPAGVVARRCGCRASNLRAWPPAMPRWMRNCPAAAAAGRADRDSGSQTGSANCGCFFPALTKLTRGDSASPVICCNRRTSPTPPPSPAPASRPNRCWCCAPAGPEDALWPASNAEIRAAAAPCSLAAAPGAAGFAAACNWRWKPSRAGVLMRERQAAQQSSARRCASRWSRRGRAANSGCAS